MSAKIGTLSATIETASKAPVVAELTPDVDAKLRQAQPKSDLIAKALTDVTASIPVTTQPKPALHKMKNVAVKARPTSIDGLLN